MKRAEKAVKEFLKALKEIFFSKYGICVKSLSLAEKMGEAHNVSPMYYSTTKA